MARRTAKRQAPPRRPASARLPNAPTPRPAEGFGSLKAQKWVLTAAILTAIIYAFRRLVEPSLNAAAGRGSPAQILLGSGSPPPPLGQWAFAYGTGFLLLSMVALAAPEVAASLAMLMIVAELLSNGTAVAADLKNIEAQKAPTTTASTASPSAHPPAAKGTAPPKGFTG